MCFFFWQICLKIVSLCTKKNILRNFFLFLTLKNPVLNLMSLFAHVINNNIQCIALKTIKTEKVKFVRHRNGFVTLKLLWFWFYEWDTQSGGGEGGGRQSITLRKIKTVFKHHLSLSEDADLLHVNSKIFIVTWKFSFFLIFGKKKLIYS